jgi:hypothetical protein
MKRHVKLFEAFEQGQQGMGDVPFDEFVEMIFDSRVVKVNGMEVHTDDVVEEDDGLYRFDVTEDITFSREDNPTVTMVGLRKFSLNVVWNGHMRQVIVRFPNMFNASMVMPR